MSAARRGSCPSTRGREASSCPTKRGGWTSFADPLPTDRQHRGASTEAPLLPCARLGTHLPRDTSRDRYNPCSAKRWIDATERRTIGRVAEPLHVSHTGYVPCCVVPTGDGAALRVADAPVAAHDRPAQGLPVPLGEQPSRGECPRVLQWTRTARRRARCFAGHAQPISARPGVAPRRIAPARSVEGLGTRLPLAAPG